MAWYFLHVRPRTEKKVDERLGILGCFHHLPLYVKVTRVQRRKVRRELPLFPGYVFARLSDEQRAEVMRMNMIVRALLVSNPRQTVHELRQIARAARGLATLRAVDCVFKDGDYVKVGYGPLRGTTGYVKSEGGRAKLYLNVEILGRSVEVEFTPDMLEPAKP